MLIGGRRFFAFMGLFLLISALLNLSILPELKQCVLNGHFSSNAALTSLTTYANCSQQVWAGLWLQIIIAALATVAITALNPIRTIAESARNTKHALLLLLAITAGFLLAYFQPGRMLLYDGVVFQAAAQSYYEIFSGGQLPLFFFPWALGSMHPVYHGQLFFALTGLINFLFHNIDAAFRATSFLLHILSAIAAFCLVKYILKDSRAALLGGVTYALIPEHTLKMLLLGRTIAAPIYALLPVAILLIERFIDGRASKKALAAWLGLISAAMFLSSPQDAQVTIALVFGYFFLRTLLKEKSAGQLAKTAAITAAAAALFLLLTSYWTVPYILESEHVNTLQQKAVYEYKPKLPELGTAAKIAIPAVGILQLMKLNIDFSLDYFGLTALILAAVAIAKSGDKRIRLTGIYGAAALLLGLFITQRTGIFAALMISIAAAAGSMKILSKLQLRKHGLAPVAFGIIFIVVAADLGMWAFVPIMPDFSKQQKVYNDEIPQFAENARVLDLHSNRRTYYPALVYMDRQAQVPFSILTAGDPKAFYYAATAASKAAQEVYDNQQELSEETRKALYMYNIGYIIVHPDQKGKTAAETFSDKAATLGFEKQQPQVTRINATPTIISAAAKKIPPISESEKGLFFTKDEFENRGFPWENVRAALNEMRINASANSAAAIPIADDKDNTGFDAAETAPNTPQQLQLKIIEHTVRTNKVIIVAETIADSYAQLSYAYYPWMEARVDGKKTEIYKSAFKLLVIKLPEGRHTIEITPKLTPLRKATTAVSLIALAAVTATLLPWQRIFKQNRKLSGPWNQKR